jgi:hypothetical protein
LALSKRNGGALSGATLVKTITSANRRGIKKPSEFFFGLYAM